MLERFINLFNQEPEDSPEEKAKRREELRKANITPGFPHLSGSVSSRRTEMFTKPNRPDTFSYNEKYYRDRGDGYYVSNDGDAISYAAAITLPILLPEIIGPSNIETENPTSNGDDLDGIHQ